MFIYHFNRLIRNRVLWGFFAVVISLTFGLSGVKSCSRQPPASTVAGTINGKKILNQEFDNTARAVRGFGNNRDNAMSAREVTRRAWEQLAARETAVRNGMPTSSEEVKDMIRDERAFQGPNGFDINRYRMILREQGMNPLVFEDMVSRQIAIMKTASLVESATWVSPMEIEDEIANMTDRFTVQVATLSNRFLTVEMRLTDDDYRKFYEENKSSFALPDRVSVNYIAIPVSNYLDRVSVPEEDLQDYYDSHADTYTRTATNDVSEPIPFAEVRDSILAELKLGEARYCAETSVTYNIYGKLVNAGPKAFKTVAAQEKLAVKASPLFGAEEPLYWAENDKEFATAAFDLDPESEDMCFAIVPADSYMYIIEQSAKSAAHTPTFEQVLNDIKPRAMAKARTEAFQSYAKELRADLIKLVAEGKSFADAAQAKSLSVSTSLTYTVSDIQSKRFENSFSIAYGAMSLKKGEISETVPASAVQSLLVYVQDRQPGDNMAAEMVRSQVRNSIARRRYSSLFGDWITWNLSQQEFKPTRPLSDTDEADGLENDDEEAPAADKKAAPEADKK